MNSVKALWRCLVRFAGRYAKIDLSYLAHGGLWLTGGHVIGVISSSVIAILFANYLPKETYGTYKYILSIVGIMTITTLPGINTYLAQAIARGYEKSVFSALRMKIRWGLLGAIGCISVASYYGIRENSTFAIAFAIAGIFLPFMDSASIYNIYLQSKKLFRKAIEYFTINQTVTTVIIASTIICTQDLLIILFAYFASWTVLRLFFFFRTVRHYPPAGTDDPKMISYGKHLSLIAVATVVAANLDSLLLFQFLGPAEVALYAFALAPIEQIRRLYKNISPLALPRLTNRTFKEINAALARRMIILLALGILIAGAFIAIAPLLFKLLFPQYLDAVFFSQLLAGFIAIRLPETFFATLIEAKMSFMPRPWLYWEVVPQFVFIGMLFILIPFFGLYGVIAAKYIAIIAGFVINVIQWRFLGTRYP